MKPWGDSGHRRPTFPSRANDDDGFLDKTFHCARPLHASARSQAPASGLRVCEMLSGFSGRTSGSFAAFRTELCQRAHNNVSFCLVTQDIVMTKAFSVSDLIEFLP